MKLFKKVAAAVLAGVMALSMVACGPTTPVTPETPETPVADSAVTEILTWMNYKRTLTDKTDEYGKVTKAQAEIKNDAELAAQAAAVLDAIADTSKENDVAVWKEASVKVLWDKVNVALNKKLANPIVAGQQVCVLTDAGLKNTWDSARANGFEVPTANLVYNMTSAAKKALAEAYATTVDAKVGIASKTINGKTCVLIVTK